MPNDLHELNRRSWNAATEAHNSHKRDQAGFLRGGGSTLFPEEVALLGDIAGKRLVHLQCNAGQDTLSLAARLGAEVVGVDISDTAIDAATRLSQDSHIAAEFVRADVYDFLDDPGQSGAFDVAFASYGAICWLSDLPRWAAGLARILRPGGRVVVMEFHPVAMMFDESLTMAFPYFRGPPQVSDEGIGDYVGLSGAGLAPMGFEAGAQDFVNEHPCYEWSWAVSDLVTALLGAGLSLEAVREWPYANGWRGFDDMRDLGHSRFGLPEAVPELPLMVGVSARRP
jgi:SAM-dependent methyltransferase